MPLASTVAEIFKGDSKFLGSFPSPGPLPLFSAWDFMMVFCKPQRLAKLEVAGFVCYGNMRKFVFKNLDKPKWGNPLFLGKTVFTVLFADPMFPIQCATFMEPRLQQIGDFLRKTAFYNGTF